ncbi:MAG: imidazole glycerol phosphate synthase, glutamine amidotransferase subunit [Chitinophagaceae bacterium]|nr:imidazole glycerol phosphate synthase, glutamine amidotransferase subunit [Chitinophagaceae bacterium]MDB5222748.1 imidazole glycerol phosphate synthase, glutamine amidotransferase subunit [Chitinophagaceae bacterium]
MITIVNYGMGNLGSVQNMFKRIGIPTEITGDINRIEKAQKLLLPGVGAFGAAMQRIEESGLRNILDKKVLEDKIPVLGICLGMQLLTRSSEEGLLPGLGWIQAQTLKFNFPEGSLLKVPHMGWNIVHPVKPGKLTENFSDETKFYFVHSYYVKADNPEDVLTTTHHGIEFHSIIQHENIYGAQFHPEKSHKFGMRLLENFARI